MANNYITFQTAPDLAEGNNDVIETVAGTTFPVAFSANQTVMVIVNRDVLGTNGAMTLESTIKQCLDRINKKLNESVNIN